MTSKPGEKSVKRIAADANVILSAITGKAALRVFTHSDIQVVTAGSMLAEVSEYLPEMAKAYRLPREVLESQLALLALKAIGPGEYQHRIPEATRLIAKRDRDDVPLLALALALNIPVWSNDRDFEGTGVEQLTTARLLAQVGIRSS